MPSQKLSKYAKSVLEGYHHLKGMLSGVPASEVTIVGSNVPDAFVQLELTRSKQDQPYAIKTPLGRSRFGRQVTANNTQKECVYSVRKLNIVQNDDLIHNSVK